ncbi:MAG: helix-turn-helix domain-containing protein [Cellulosilyticaceae bacterium]
MNRKIKMLTQRTLRENILEYLNQQCIEQNTRRVLLPINKKEWADYLGVQRPSLFRELKKMKEEGIIQITNRIVELL